MPAGPTVEDAFVPTKKPIPGAYHISRWTDENGNVHFEENPELKALLEEGEQPFADDIEMEIREARVAALEAEADLQKYVEEKTREAEEISFNSPSGKVAGQPDLTEDKQYALLQARVDDAYARLRQLGSGGKKPAAQLEAEAAQDDEDVIAYDALGNRL
jgi:hypothetical protein